MKSKLNQTVGAVHSLSSRRKSSVRKKPSKRRRPEREGIVGASGNERLVVLGFRPSWDMGKGK
jgi:hypothetical protein